MNGAKLQLSEEEWSLTMRADWLLTKNRIMASLMDLFGSMAGAQQQMLAASADLFPDEVMAIAPKISRGEQYQGLPYLVLDYPRQFGREDICAIRSFFWWGHFFSLSLHLRGSYRDRYLPALRHHWSVLAQAGFCISVGEDEWRHDWEADNYQPMQTDPSGRQERFLTDRPFCKISARLPLQQWKEMPQQLIELYAVLIGALRLPAQDQLPRR